ncbi:IS3 family transposase [Lysobacter pythonis]|uniref:IS3 family transposase n=2 Tax=Solilutibacter pythonis TaxID=2483112 RepID=A0A3M2HIY0_9GAMM|nr:IS3 family transposase [Lysobacter pythonis]RMH87319.1 IS3 family transposase [Lysobacter pythonis]
MAKYSAAFKREVVDTYLKGQVKGASENGFKRLARLYGVPRSQIRHWVSLFKEHGQAGLERRRQHQRLSAEAKLQILQHMWREELSQTQTVALYGLRNNSSLSLWERQYNQGGIDALKPRPRARPPVMPKPEPPPAPPPVADSSATHEQLLRENAYLRAEVAYLKKPRRLGSSEAAEDSAEKTRIVLELRQQHTLSDLLAISGLARSTFYYQAKVLTLGDRHAGLKAAIQTLYNRHKGRYGYRRIAAALRHQLGEAINHKLVQRLMQVMGLKSLVRPKRYKSYKGEVGGVAPNLLERDFKADEPEQKWVTDVTEFKVNGEKLYLSPVMDLYNREIVAFQLDAQPSFKMVRAMLDKAWAKRRTRRPLVLHSDQGWQYQMSAFQRQLDQHQVTPSMSRKGNCLDNAAMESFFATLKSELFYLKKFADVEQLRKEVADYIHYYNHDRIMLKLKGLSPVQYRTQPLAA